MTVYTLFGQPASPATLASDGATYNMGVQFSVNVSGATATGIWFYSPPGADVLPDWIDIYQVTGGGTGTLVVQQNLPSWSGAVGSGWVRASFTSPPTLTSGQAYKGCVAKTTGGNFYAATAHYWDTGSGSGGVTNGPLSAPNNAGADVGQDSFAGPLASPSYPNGAFNAANYWVDVEVTTSGATNVSVSDAAGMVESLTIATAISLADVAGAVDSVAVFPQGTPISVSDFAGVVESLSISVSNAVHDSGASLDSLFRPGAVANRILPALILMASAYQGST